MNNYLIIGNDSYALKLKEEDLININHFLDADIKIYDLEEVLLKKPLEDLDTYSFLTPKKVIIIKNLDKIKYDDFKEEIKHLLSYLENPLDTNLLILEVEKFNTTSSINKNLKKYLKIEELVIDNKKIIKNILKDFKISNNDINLIIDRCLNDSTKIKAECEKLKNYKYEEKVITKEDIIEMVSIKKSDNTDDLFNLIHSLGTRDKKKSLEILKSIDDIEPYSLIGLLASQFRIMYQVKLLSKRNISNDEIAKILEEKSAYRIKKTRELLFYYDEKELLLLMEDIKKIDLLLKTTDQDPLSLLELFILNL